MFNIKSRIVLLCPLPSLSYEFHPPGGTWEHVVGFCENLDNAGNSLGGIDERGGVGRSS